MSDGIKTVYMCSICHAQYDAMENAEKCFRSHNDASPCMQITLCNHYSNLKYEYKFEYYKYWHRHDWPKIDISVTSQDEIGYPRFTTNCPDTPFDILAAKMRLIKAAYKWSDKLQGYSSGAGNAVEGGRMTKEEFIESLTLEELKLLVGEFWYWHSEEECPREQDHDFPCTLTHDDDFEPGEYETDCCPYEQYGCWAEYYLWKFRQKGGNKNE